MSYPGSEYGGHVPKWIQECNISQYDAIVTTSGDGLFHEVINGILARPDWESARHIPLGMIAGGTASALNKNLSTLYPEWAVMSIIKGRDV